MANNFRVRDLIADNVYISENNGNVVNTFGDQLILGDKIFSGSNLFTGDSVSIETTGLNNFGLNSSENNFGSNSSGNYFGSNSSGNYFGLSGDNKYHSGEFIGDFVFDSIPKISGSIFVTDFVTTTRNQTISGQKTFTSIPQVSGFNCIIDNRNYIPSITGYSQDIKNLFYSLNPYSKSEFIVNSFSESVFFSTGDLQILTPTIKIHNVGSSSWSVVYGDSPPSTLISIKPLTSASFFLWKPATNTPLQVYNYTETEIRYDQLGVLKASEAVNALYDQTITGIKNFKSRPTVNGTGVMLNGEAAQLPTTLVYTTGNQDISGIKNFTSLPTVNNTGIYLNSNPSGFITTSQTGAFYPTTNPSGYAATGYVTGVSGNLQTQISTLNNATGNYVLTSQTGQFYPNSNPSGYISSLLTSRTIYVDTNGTDTRGSLSQYSISVPFATIGAAMAASVSGDTVRVRAGSYTITSTISLNGKGYLHFEEGAVVTCSVTASGPVFYLNANESKSISGGGQFIITGSTTIFWYQTGGGLQTQLCSVECATINTTTSPLNAATIFDVSSGVLVVNAETVYALASTIISCAGTSSNLHYAVKFTYCSRFAFFPTSGSQAQMSCDCWTIACYGTKCFQIVGGTVGAKYETLLDNSNNCTFFSLEYGNDSIANALVIKGGRAMTYSTNPCINFTTTTGTNKFVRLIGDPFFYTNATNSISAASARSVLCSFASSNKAVNSSFVTIVGGTYAVNAGFIS